MWRPRDHERFIGGYDPEHEMPDPDRSPRDRWQSDAYRYGAHDSRYPDRWNPDRFEDRFRDRDDRREWEMRWNSDARDSGYRPGYPGDYGRSDYGRPDYDRNFDRGYDRGYDRYEFDRSWNDRNRGGYYEGDFNSGWRGDADRSREFGGRGYERDWRDRQRFSSDRDNNSFDDDDRWRNRRW